MSMNSITHNCIHIYTHTPARARTHKTHKSMHITKRTSTHTSYMHACAHVPRACMYACLCTCATCASMHISTHMPCQMPMSMTVHMSMLIPMHMPMYMHMRMSIRVFYARAQTHAYSHADTCPTRTPHCLDLPRIGGGGGWLARHGTSIRWARFIDWTFGHAHRAVCRGEEGV